MSLQNAVNVSVIYKPEVTFGTPDGASAGKVLRRISSTLALNKDAFSSAEVRVDQQVADARHGMRRAAGTIEGELSNGSYDDFLEALLRGTWAAGTTKSNTEFTNVAADNTAGTFTVGASTWIAQGFKIGDIIRFTTLSESTNNSKNFRITNLSGTVATVFPKPTTMAADTSFTVAVQGSKLLCGTAKRSFTIEQSNPDIDISELFKGMRVASGNFRLPPNAMATCSFEFLGQDAEFLASGASPYYGSPTAAGSTSVLAGTNGVIRLNGADYSLVTGLDFSVALNLSAQPVVGSNIAPDVFYGRTVINGNVSTFLENDSLLQAFDDETEIDLQCVLDAAGADPKDFMSFYFRRVKFMGMQKTNGPDGGVIASFPFQALLNTGGAGTTSDTSSMVIQRSNAS